MIDRKWAEHFSRAWIAAWNAHDLDAILSHYAETIVFHSPRIALVMNDPVASISGKVALEAYWKRALGLAPELRFEFERLYVGRDSLSIAYRNHREQHACETFLFGDDGLVLTSVATYS